jgi:hypothetical protein
LFILIRALAIEPNNTFVLDSKGLALDVLEKYGQGITNDDKALAINLNETNVLDGIKASFDALSREK